MGMPDLHILFGNKEMGRVRGWICGAFFIGNDVKVSGCADSIQGCKRQSTLQQQLMASPTGDKAYIHTLIMELERFGCDMNL